MRGILSAPAVLSPRNAINPVRSSRQSLTESLCTTYAGWMRGGDPRVELRNVQLLRALAALAVVLAHAGALNEISGVTVFPAYNGFYGVAGVDMFFVISGFIMIHITRGDVRPGLFLLARAARIYPLWWICTLIASPIIIGVTFGYPHQYSDERIAYLARSLFLLPTVAPSGKLVHPPVGVGWTLIYEMFFYIVFAAVLLTGKRFRSLKASAALLACHALTYVLPADSTTHVFLSNPIYLEFILGMAVAEIYFAGWLRWPVVAASLVVATMVVWLAPPSSEVYEQTRHLWFGVPAAAVLALALALEDHGVRVPRDVAFLGDASYALYLTQHFTLLYLPMALYPLLGTLTPWLWFALVVLAAQAIACVVYVSLDRPLHEAARRLVGYLQGNRRHAVAT